MQSGWYRRRAEDCRKSAAAALSADVRWEHQQQEKQWLQIASKIDADDEAERRGHEGFIGTVGRAKVVRGL